MRSTRHLLSRNKRKEQSETQNASCDSFLTRQRTNPRCSPFYPLPRIHTFLQQGARRICASWVQTQQWLTGIFGVRLVHLPLRDLAATGKANCPSNASAISLMTAWRLKCFDCKSGGKGGDKFLTFPAFMACYRG